MKNLSRRLSSASAIFAFVSAVTASAQGVVPLPVHGLTGPTAIPEVKTDPNLKFETKVVEFRYSWSPFRPKAASRMPGEKDVVKKFDSSVVFFEEGGKADPCTRRTPEGVAVPSGEVRKFALSTKPVAYSHSSHFCEGLNNVKGRGAPKMTWQLADRKTVEKLNATCRIEDYIYDKANHAAVPRFKAAFPGKYAGDLSVFAGVESYEQRDSYYYGYSVKHTALKHTDPKPVMDEVAPAARIPGRVTRDPFPQRNFPELPMVCVLAPKRE